MPLWMTPELWPVWCRATCSCLSIDDQSGVGAARADLAGDGEADDPGADHHDVVQVLNSLTHVRTHP